MLKPAIMPTVTLIVLNIISVIALTFFVPFEMDGRAELVLELMLIANWGLTLMVSGVLFLHLYTRWLISRIECDEFHSKYQKMMCLLADYGWSCDLSKGYPQWQHIDPRNVAPDLTVEQKQMIEEYICRMKS